MDPTTDPVPPPMPSGTPSFPIVGIGASAGGLEAYTELLRFLPSDTGMAYVLVQHLDPARPSLLASLLARATAMEVREARDGQDGRATGQTDPPDRGIARRDQHRGGQTPLAQRVSDPEHATFPGLGLGLFISAQIIRRHGGRMWVDSQPGAGSPFFFTVPGTPRPASGPLPLALRQEGEASDAEKNPGGR